MSNILESQDITFAKDGDKKYKLQPFQYHLKTLKKAGSNLIILKLYMTTKRLGKKKRRIKILYIIQLKTYTSSCAPLQHHLSSFREMMDIVLKMWLSKFYRACIPVALYIAIKSKRKDPCDLKS